MRAIIQNKYGPLDVLKREAVPKPAPKADEVLLRVHASSINFANLALVSGRPFIARFWSGLFKPNFNIPGGDVAGTVESVGDKVRQFKPGDKVYGDLADSGFGAFADYVCTKERYIALKPSNLSFEKAAAVPQAAVVALQGLRDKGAIKSGDHVLIYGASGGIGTFAVQIAKAFGAEVTGLCSTRNLELVKSIGADHVIDYTHEDFVKGGPRYDLILATAGYRPITDYRKALNSQGRYVMAGGSMKQIMEANMRGPRLSETNGRTLMALSAKANQDDLVFVKELIKAGKVEPVIDRQFPLNQVPQALHYYGEGRTRGKIVISMSA